MTLDYEILWIDDREEFFKNHEDHISDYLSEKGFEPKITKYSNFSQFYDDNNKLSNYDLFLIDLKLDNNKSGNEIIKKIRDDKILTDIIFYSTVLKEVMDIVKKNDIEGVYVTSRALDDFEAKVTNVIDVTIKKVQDVNNLRGLIMAEVSELDIIKTDIIKKFITNNPDDDILKKYIKENIFEKDIKEINEYDFLTKNGKSYLNCNSDLYVNLEELLSNFIFDSNKKARTVFKIKKLKECTDIDFTVEKYINEILKKRNVFAHEKEQIRDNGIKFLNYPDGNYLEFTEENCIKIRKDIKRYKNILRDIESKL